MKETRREREKEKAADRGRNLCLCAAARHETKLGAAVIYEVELDVSAPP
jgi:hypothetical protein